MTCDLHRIRRSDGDLVDRIRNLILFAVLTPRDEEAILVCDYLMSVAFQGEKRREITPRLRMSGRAHS